MSKIFMALFLCVSVVACGAKTQPQQAYKPSERITVLVSYFQRNSNREDLEPYRVGLAEMFLTELAAMPQLQVVERNRMDVIMDELGLAQLGVIDPETAQEIGRIVGAQAFYKGSFTTFGNMMRLDGQLIRLETYEVEAAAEDTCEISDKQIFRMVSRQSKIIAKKIEAIHGELIADNFYSRGRTAEEQNDRGGAIRYYQQALEYHKDHELSQKALNRLQPM